MATRTKDRILDSTAELFRRHGYTGTGLKQVVQAANAPFGSLYHFFPGGKEQLGREVIHRSGALYFSIFETMLDAAPDVVTGTQDFFAGAAVVLEETGYEDACPIATVALEVASTNEPLREATAEVFESWITGATRHFTAAGIPPERGRELAIFVIAVLEGAFMLCRATRSTEAMHSAGARATAAVREALEAAKA